MKSNLVKLGITTILGICILPTSLLAASIINIGNVSYKLGSGQEELTFSAKPGETISQDVTISNNSEEKLNLSLQKKKKKIDSTGFRTEESNSDLKSWIQLSKNEFSIEPHHSEKLKINIEVPLTAGIGTHYGALLGKYEVKNSDSEKLYLENGIKIRGEIKGNATSAYTIINPTIFEKSGTITYSGKVFNSGNTNLDGEITLNGRSQKLSILPKDIADFSLQSNKMGKDISIINLNEISKAYLLNSTNNERDSGLLLIFAAIGLGIILLNRFKKLSLGSVSFILLCLISVGIFNQLENTNSLRTDLISQNQKSYLTTIKFGNLPEKLISKSDKIQWNGSLQINQGKMVLVQKLHNEPADQIYLNQEGNTLYFNNITGPDNDGVILLIKTDSTGEKPKLRYYNALTGQDQVIDLEKTLSQTYNIGYKNFGIEIRSETPGSTIQAYINNKAYNLNTFDSANSQVIKELSSTEEISSIVDYLSTPEIEIQPIPSDQLKNELNLLQEIINEIPASSEILTDYILNSEHVEEVTYDNNITTVKADGSLINTLKETPLTIDELTSSPEVNFIFTSNEKINLTPQQFSFTETRTSSQLLGEIVLVQNRESNWSTSLSISDFESLSGGASISAENIVIAPGKVKTISQKGSPAEIIAGQEHRFTGSNDQAVLVNIIPNGNEKTIFSIQPTLSVRVPAGTPPGRYKANITIRVL